MDNIEVDTSFNTNSNQTSVLDNAKDKEFNLRLSTKMKFGSSPRPTHTMTLYDQYAHKTGQKRGICHGTTSILLCRPNSLFVLKTRIGEPAGFQKVFHMYSLKSESSF